MAHGVYVIIYYEIVHKVHKKWKKNELEKNKLMNSTADSNKLLACT